MSAGWQGFGCLHQLMAGLVIVALTGCSELPASAPTSAELEQSLDHSAGQPGLSYTLVDIDNRVASILHSYHPPGFAERFIAHRYKANDILHPGDVIGVYIYEAGGPTFLPPSSGTQGAASPETSSFGGVSTIPPQMIEADGTIMIPFVGRIKVAGKTPGQVGTEIQRLLKGKAVEPQVVVTLVNNVSNTATVGGDVNSPKPVPLTLHGERLLDVIAAAGGAKFPAYEMYVTLIRHRHRGTVLLQSIVLNPRENLVVEPGDQIFLTHYPRTFAVLGATTKVSQYTFDTAEVTLAEAVARAGGPVDTIGNPSGVYLFRYEPIAVAKQVLGDRLKLPSADSGKPDPKFIPVLYKINFRTAAGYFLAQDVDMRDKDVVLITNAETTQLVKLLTAVRGFTGIAYDLSRNASNF